MAGYTGIVVFVHSTYVKISVRNLVHHEAHTNNPIAPQATLYQNTVDCKF